MKSTQRSDYKIYKVTKGSGQVGKQYIYVEYLFAIFHLICVAFLMLLNIREELKETIPLLEEGIGYFQDNFMQINQAQIISFVSIGLSMLLIVIIVVRVKLISMYDRFNTHKKLEKYLLVGSLTIAYIYQLAIYPIGWAIDFVYQSNGFFQFIAVGFLPMIVYTYFNLKMNTTSLYRWSTIKIIFFLTSLQSFFSYLVIIALSLYFIIKEKMLLRKISYGFIILLSIFVFKHTIFANIPQQQMLISLVPLAILVVLTPFLIFKLKSKSPITSHQAEIQQAYILLSQITEIPFKQLRFKQFHILYSTVMDLMQLNKDDKNKQIQHILKKVPQQMTKNDFFFLLERYLDKEIKKSTKNKIHKEILRFKIRMQLNYPISQMSEQLFLINQEYLRSNKSRQHDFFSILDQAINRYCVFNDGILQTAFIYYSNELHQNFQEKVIYLLDKISTFWKNMAHQQIKRIELDDSFDEIIKLRGEIYNMSQQMEKYGHFQREKKVVSILKSLFNSYEEEGKISIEHIKTIFQVNEQQINHSFLILQDNFIKFVTKDLVKNLGDKTRTAYENVNKKTLFGDEFSEIIDSMVKNMNMETQKEWGTIPILRKNGLIDLKKINIMWYPSLETKCRLMIRFEQDGELRKSGYMIYENRTDTIKYANEKFIDDFNINKERFMQKLGNQQIFFNELFIQGEVSLEGMKRQLKEDTEIKCKMCLKGFVSPGALNLVSVDIRVIKTIYMENNPGYLILRVAKTDEKKDPKPVSIRNLQKEKNRLQEKSINEAIQLSNKNYRSLALKYEKQKFFCPIPNNYESKIIQKQAQLDQKNRWIGRYYLHLIMGVMFSTIIVFWSLDYKFYSDRVASYKGERTAVQNTSEQYALLYELYGSASKRYYYGKYADQILSVTGRTFQIVDTSIKAKQQAYIDEFLLRYLTQISAQPNSRISYNLQFEYFNISTDTDHSTLVDFAQKFKRNIVNNDLDFLLKNYESFRNLTIKYEASFVIEQQIDQITASYNMYYYILIAISLTCTGLIFYAMYKIEAAITVVYTLFQMVGIKKFQENQKRFNSKKQKIINSLHKPVNTSRKFTQNMNNNFSNNTQYSSTTHLTVTETNHDHNQSQSTLRPPSSHHITSKDSSNDNSYDIEVNQNEVNEKKSLLTQNEQLQVQKVQQKQRIIDEPILLKMARKFYFISLLIGFNIVFYFDQVNIQIQNDGYTQLFNIRKNLYDSLLHVTRIQTDAIIQPVMRDYFNRSINFLYDASSVDLVADISQDLIFTQLLTFKEEAKNYLANDMCSNLGSQITYNIKPCNTYLNGIVTKGFGQTFDPYQLNAKILGNQLLSDFGPYPCTVHNCTPFYEHSYVAALMSTSIRKVVNILNISINKLGDSRLSKLTQKIMFKMIGIACALMIYIILDHNLKNRCKRSIEYFRMIPKQMMCTMKITRYMRKKQILSEFDLL